MTEKQFINLSIERRIQLNEEKASTMIRFLDLVLEKNKVMNLTAIRDKEEAIEKHLFDSLLPSLACDFEGKSIADIGSGAGFPGIVLAILYPNAHFTLIEPMTKRCNFLNEVKQALNLLNIDIVNERAENLTNFAEKFDICIARAVARLNVLVEIITPLLKVGGMFIAMKSLSGDEEIKEAQNGIKKLNLKIESVVKDKLPICNDERNQIVIKKINHTPDIYPRNYAKILKRPL